MELGKHRLGADEILVIILDPLQPRDMADRAQCHRADLAHPFGDVIGRIDQRSKASGQAQRADRNDEADR